MNAYQLKPHPLTEVENNSSENVYCMKGVRRQIVNAL